MATSIGSNYNFATGMMAQTQFLQAMDVSSLTSGNISAADSATLSNVLGSDYTNYQNMLSSLTGTSSSASGIGSVSNGVGLTADGMFDFKSYISTYFPNFSEEQIESYSALYTESYNQMFSQIGGAMDMSKLAGLVTGTDMSSLTGLAGGAANKTTDYSSILTQTAAANKAAYSSSGSSSNGGFNVSDYISSYFPSLSSSQVSDLTSTYNSQYASLAAANNN